MDEKERAELEKFGVDIAMLKANLKRTPMERIRRHQSALNLFLKLKEAKKVSDHG